MPTEIVSFADIWDYAGKIFLLLFITSGVIQIAPIKLNPWGWIAKRVGNLFHADLNESIKETRKEIAAIKTEIDSLREEVDEANIKNARIRILRFADDLYDGSKHYSKEHFDTILDDITVYNKYCDAHPNFKNHRTVQAKKFIDQCYSDLLQSHGFANQGEEED